MTLTAYLRDYVALSFVTDPNVEVNVKHVKPNARCGRDSRTELFEIIAFKAERKS